MKRVPGMLAAFVVATTMFAQPTAAIPGPDPDPHNFQIFIGESPTGIEYDRLFFSVDDGWDFGNRRDYGCAYWESLTDSSVDATFDLELVSPYPIPDVTPHINDKFGETSRTDEPCGQQDGRATYDGSDHFPHFSTMESAQATGITLYRDGVPFRTLDLRRDPCSTGYWTPGDFGADAWLWWDPDGPLSDGHMDLDCEGGPIEPVAVAHLTVNRTATGIGWCVSDDMDGDHCNTSPTPPPPTEHASSVTLRLTGNLAAVGRVASADGVVECIEERDVQVQRRVSGDWETVGSDRTNATGWYRLHIPARPGRYRAQVSSSTLTDGDICSDARSRTRLRR